MKKIPERSRSVLGRFYCISFGYMRCWPEELHSAETFRNHATELRLTGWETTLLISVTSEFYSHSDERKAHVCSWGTGQVAARYDRDVTVGAVPPLLSKRPCICITLTAVAIQDCLSICLSVRLLPLARCQIHYSTCGCEAQLATHYIGHKHSIRAAPPFGNKTDHGESDRYKYTILLRI